MVPPPCGALELTLNGPLQISAVPFGIITFRLGGVGGASPKFY